MGIALVNFGETIDKIERKLKGDVAKINLSTMKSADDAMNNLLAAEIHIREIMNEIMEKGYDNKDPDILNKLNKLYNDVYDMRVKIANSKIPMRTTKYVSKDTLKELRTLYSKFDEIIEEIDNLGIEMRQFDLSCPKCVDDFMGKLGDNKVIDVTPTVVEEVHVEEENVAEEGSGQRGDTTTQDRSRPALMPLPPLLIPRLPPPPGFPPPPWAVRRNRES